MLFLFTDFGWHGPYTGELKAVLARSVSEIPVIDLMHDAPCFNPVASARLLMALSRQFIPGDYCLAIVDPGVGNTARRPVVVVADEVTYVGPDNGLFALIAAAAENCKCSEILWRPENLSASFHGRDLFAPVIAREIDGIRYAQQPLAIEELVGYGKPARLEEVIYIDGYGNCITGLSESDLVSEAVISVNTVHVKHAHTFSMVEPGTVFWYINSMGLVEIACNQGSAAACLGLSLGSPLSVH